MTQPIDTEALLPCPFCGGTRVYIRQDKHAYIAPQDFIALCYCGACGPNVSSEDAAARAWNTRTAQLKGGAK